MTLARCELPEDDSDAFCDGGHQHPRLSAGPGELVLTYGIVTWSDDADARIAAAPKQYRLRLVHLDRPSL